MAKTRDMIKDEVIHAIKMLKNNKAAGPDQLPEILKLIEDDQIHILVELINTIYTTYRNKTRLTHRNSKEKDKNNFKLGQKPVTRKETSEVIEVR